MQYYTIDDLRQPPKRMFRKGYDIRRFDTVEGAIAHNLIGHGAGNIVYRVSRETGLGIRETGLKLAQGELWDKAAELFEEVRA